MENKITQQHFLIIDKINSVTHKIDIEPNKGIIRQVNEAYDKFLKENDYGRED